MSQSNTYGTACIYKLYTKWFKAYLWLQIAMHYSLKMTEGHHAQNLYNNCFGIFFCVSPASSIIQISPLVSINKRYCYLATRDG